MNDIEYKNMYEVEDSHWWYVSLHELICSYLTDERSRVGAPLEMLDAGCGTGRLMQLMGSYGRVEGFDMSERALGLCRHRGVQNVRQDNLNGIVLEECRFDVITSIDVLYHRAVKDESAIINQFRRALKPGGLLILNLVAFEFLRSTHDVAVHTRKRYTRNELEPLLTRNGFNVESSTYRHALLFLPIALYRLLRRILPHHPETEKVISDVSPPAKKINELLLFISRLENRQIRSGSLPFGTSLFVTARCS
jgi:SAM-dependent methyltransferase